MAVAGGELCRLSLPRALAWALSLVSLNQSSMWKDTVTIIADEIFLVWTVSAFSLCHCCMGNTSSLGCCLPLKASVTAYAKPSVVSQDLDSCLYQGLRPMHSSVMMADASCSLEMTCYPEQEIKQKRLVCSKTETAW